MSLTPRAFFGSLRWLDGRPLLAVIEPYRLDLFDRFFLARDGDDGGLQYNLGLFGRAKKNWKTADLMLAALFAQVDDSPGGNQIYIVCNDEDQAADDLTLCKKILAANPTLAALLTIQKRTILRKDGRGFIEILPGKDAIGAHGKTYRLLCIDEIHGFRDWAILEAMAPDPTRTDCQTLITSYATIFHKPGVPLFDLMKLGKEGTDPRMLLSWYAADYCTDPAFAEKSPEEKANPSMLTWGNPRGYLAQQQRRLPAHKYRRLHLNLPGLPEGSAFQPEPIFDSIVRGMRSKGPEPGTVYRGFVDMSGGSNDDAVAGVGYRDADGRKHIVALINQGQPPPFDPNAAVLRFCAFFRKYGVASVTGDAYAGLTFSKQFESNGIAYEVCDKTTNELYEALEPVLNAGEVVLPDEPLLEQQLLGLVWRGGRIDHPVGEHDDYANCAAGLIHVLVEAGLPGLPHQVECYREVSIGQPVACYLWMAGAGEDLPPGPITDSLQFGGGYIPAGCPSCSACPSHRYVMAKWKTAGSGLDLRTFRALALGDNELTTGKKAGLGRLWDQRWADVRGV